MTRFACITLLMFLVLFPRAQKLLYTAPLGVQAYTFTKSVPVDVAGTLDTIRLMGFTEIEGGGGRVPPE